jgi:maltose alpha-D-glucosyltransferase / alpha-amylase
LLDLWYKNAIIYSLNVATFMDGNGDGIGDFAGLTQKLDHIAKLGANCIWLLPFYPSPRLDHGYDVTNYYGVASELGSLGDFVEFSHQARLRGLRLIIDLPINHTSDQHPWFQGACADPRSPYREYYVWSKTNPDHADDGDGVAFPGYQSSVWTYSPRARAWFFHRFYEHQPDLNILNKCVREEIFKIVGFWLELGVSGFRIDAAPFVVEEVRPNQPIHRHYEFFGELRNFLSWRRGDAILLAEANVAPEEMPAYFGNGVRLHMLFAFLLNQYMFLALARRRAEPLERGLRLLPKLPELGQWAQFLRNHDELDLGRLAEAERQEVYAAFCADQTMQLYRRGIRRRLAPMFRDRRRLELAFSIMFSLPGAAIIYYGDEIGMGDDLSLPERWPVRTCMQWSDDPNAGFSTADEDRLIHPAVMEGEFGAKAVNATAQQRDPDSLFSWIRRLVDARQSAPEVGWGEAVLLQTDNPAIFAHRLQWKENTSIVLHNLDSRRCRVRVELSRNEKGRLTDLFGDHVYEPNNGETSLFDLKGFGYRWFRVDPLASA